MAERGRKRIGFWPRMAGLGVASGPVIQGAIAAASGSPWLGAGLVATAPFVYRVVRTTTVSDADYRLPESTLLGSAKPLVANLIGMAGAGTAMGYAVSGLAPMAVSVVAGTLVSGAYALSLSSQYMAHYVEGKERQAREARALATGPVASEPDDHPDEPAPRADLTELSRAAAVSRAAAKGAFEAGQPAVQRQAPRAINVARPDPDPYRVPGHLRAAPGDGAFPGP